MKRPTDEIVLTKLVERGHLTAEAIERVRVEFETAATVVGEHAENQPSLLDCLIESELVEPSIIADLVREAMVDVESTADSEEGFPVRGLDRFEYLGLLGAGGMGQVFKAHDSELDRVVAIKFFHSGDEQLRRRFAVEARAQAKVAHPNVCEVFDVGVAEGRQYIVMQFIDGASLKDLASSLTLERRVRLIRDVARAVHAANRTGLIHRDLKPGNVMVATSGDEPPVPYVVDFGIAHDTEGPEMTMTGDLLGSPAFMAPEQAKGDSIIDRRTDVYGLGATLYSALTGRPPFHGATAFDTLMMVQLDDPPPLRSLDESIPQDLESIVLKSLEKDPSRRYQSAKDLADDLDRFLDGRPVVARPVGPWRRSVKWVQRHRTLSVGLGVLVLSILIATGLGLRASAQARETQRLTLLFGTEAQRLDAMMRVAHLLPLHDIGPDRDRIRARMQWIREQQNGVRGRARAPGWYALGRGHLVLEELKPARVLLKDAWDAGFRSPDVAYAYGLTLGRIYDEEVSSLHEIRDTEARKQRRGELQTELRDPAVELLGAAKDVEGIAPSYVKGLLADYESDHDRAIELARETIEAEPYQYEAWLLLGESALSLVSKAKARGDETAAQEALETADGAFSEAARLARSDPRPHSRLCTLWGIVMGMRLYGGGGDLEGPLETAVAACDRALIADPGRKQERMNKAICYRQMAELAIRSGEDPTEWLELGRESIREILKIESKSAGAHINLADSYAVAVTWYTGFDPDSRPVTAETALEWSRLGVESGLAAVELDPESVTGYRALGTASMMRTQILMDAGLDPEETMVLAESAFQRAEAIDHEALFVINNHAWALLQRAEYEFFSGGHPGEALDSCIRTAERALEIKPNHTTAMIALGRAQVMKARVFRLDGEDPGPMLDEAQMTFDTLIETNSDILTGPVGRVSVMAERALRATALGNDASVEIERGLSAADSVRDETSALRGLRWDWAVLKTLSAAESPSSSARRRLAREAVALFDEIAPSRRSPDWDERRAIASRLAAP